MPNVIIGISNIKRNASLKRMLITLLIMEIKVTNPKYSQLTESISCKEIEKNENIKDLVKVNGADYIVLGTVSSHEKGYEAIWGHKAVLLSEYKGKKKPLIYSDHIIEVRFGNRPQGYKEVIVKHKNINYVLVGKKIEFINTNAETQTKIF